MGLSVLDRLAVLPAEARVEYLDTLTNEQLEALLDQDWSVRARPEQLPPDLPHLIWLIRAGRGWGKTETGAQTTIEDIKQLTPQVPDGRVRWFVAGPTRGDVRATMFEGETGFARILPPSMLRGGSWDRSFNKSDLTLTLSTGAILQGFSSEKPARARGPQHHGGWADEPGTFADATLGLDEDSFMANLLFGLRLEPVGRLVVTGTPRRNRLFRELRAMDGVVETHGRTRDNLHNLSRTFKRTVVARYLGTRLGRQELDAELIEDLGTRFQRGWFIRCDEPPWPAGTPVQRIRFWDIASTEPNETNEDPDFTAGVRVAFDPQSRLFLIEHVVRFRAGPGKRERLIRQTALEDGLTTVHMEQAGNGGKDQVHLIASELEPLGIAVQGHTTGPNSKSKRAELHEAAGAQRRLYMLEGTWNTPYLDEHEEFPDGPHDDMVDATSGAFAQLVVPSEMEGSAGDLFAGAVA